MYFSMDVRRAKKGDCLLIHFGPENDPRLMMIDGGPSKVYGPHLKPRLKEIKEARQLDGKPLPVDLLMVSHVDDDHIKGILELTKQEKDAVNAHESPFLKVRSLWHNSFDAIIDSISDPLASLKWVKKETASANETKKFNMDERVAIEINSGKHDEIVESNLKILASVAQGYQLRIDAEFLKWKNAQFGKKLVMAAKGGKQISLDHNLTLTVVGPLDAELRALQKKHNKWLADLKKKGELPPEAALDMLAAYVDPSVTNLSSIVVLAELDGKTMLLTGDARGDKILKGLEFTGLLEPGGTMDVDILKGPHHGSDNNVDDDFFKRVRAKHYVFSGDGKHGNPERGTLEMVWKARKKAKYKIHLTYPPKELDVLRKTDWEEKQEEEKRKAKKPTDYVRPNWNSKKHSLTALLNDNPDLKSRVSYIEDNTPYLIDLDEEVPF